MLFPLISPSESSDDNKLWYVGVGVDDGLSSCVMKLVVEQIWCCSGDDGDESDVFDGAWMVCKDGWRSDLVEMEVTKWFGCKTVSQKIVVAEGCVCEERT